MNTPNYLDHYTDGGLYDTLEYGSPYVSKGVKFARYLIRSLEPKSKVLCIGCGSGWEVVEYIKNGMDAYGTETHPIDIKILKGRIVDAICPDLPFAEKSFDLIHCTEVLEHIPVELTDSFLKECKRAGVKCFFSIATEDDDFGTHINLHDVGWWYQKFSEVGFEIINMQFKPIFDLIVGNMSFRANYKSGVMILCQ